MQNFISDKVLKLNELFYTAGCKFLSDGRIRYFVPVKDNQSAITCDWTVVMGTIDGAGGNKYEKCANITVNRECKSTIRIYTNILKVAPPSMADAEIKYEVSHMTYSAISGATFELLYRMNEALVEQMKKFLDANKSENKEPVKPKSSKSKAAKTTGKKKKGQDQ